MLGTLVPKESKYDHVSVRKVIGEEASVDAAVVLAIFNAVVRIADATGTPLEETKARVSVDIRDALGLEGA